jgi:type IV pilus assembly protein PilC
MSVATKKTTRKTKTTPRLTTYEWQGLDKKGKKIRGKVLAKDLNFARAQLRKQEIRPTKIGTQKEPLFASFRKRSLSDKAITFFTRQLATMLRAGVPLVTALDIIGRDHKNPEFTRLLDSLRTNVESGTSLSDVLAQHPKYFDNLYVNLVAAGEMSGTLDETLMRIADYKEKILALKAKVKRAMIYPASIIVTAIVVTAIILLYAIPVFEDLFRSVNMDLPALTQWVISVSHAFADHVWKIFLLAIAVFLLLLRAWNKSETFQRRVGGLVLKLPIVGNILANAALARFARTLTITFGSGVPIMQALKSVADTTDNTLFSDAVLRMRDGVSTGQSLSFTMLQEPLFPVLIQQMVTIGEESGSLEYMMDKAANYYESEVDSAVEVLTTLMEPIIIVIIGIIVGTLVIAMYLPIFHLGEAF